MKNNALLNAVSLVVLGFVMGCASGVIGGKPKVQLSDKNGTTRIFEVNELKAIAAISNAFGDYRYKYMTLYEAAKWPDIIPGHTVTEGFVLCSYELGGIAKVPLDRARTKWVPYFADFHITVKSFGRNQTKVTVRSIRPLVIDGKEIGLHFGPAVHYRNVPPVRQEEENILLAIAEELSRAKDVK